MAGLFGGKDPQQKANAAKIREFQRLVREKKYDQALRSGAEYLSRVPANHDVLFTVGGTYYMRKKYRTAISYFERALEIGEYDTEVLLLKAYSHQRLGQRQDAIRCCEKIREVDPKNKQVSELLESL